VEPIESGSVLQLLTIYVLYLGAAMIPGPNLLVISGASLGASRAHGVATALGGSTGTVILSASSLAGLSAVVVTVPSAATALRLCGAAYLFYLGSRALVSAARGASVHPPDGRSGDSLGRAYVTGLLTHLSNPKAVVFYISLMTIVAAPQTPIGVQFAAAAGMVALSLGWYASVALALSNDSVRKRYTRGARWIDALLGTALVGAGIRLALSRSD
jgi:threonine/homoserine/homoserine lactone efflux protein